MFPGMTSLTGGGGLSSSSSASGQTGDQANSIGFQGGQVNFGQQGMAASNNQLLLVAGVALVAFLLWRKK